MYKKFAWLALIAAAAVSANTPEVDQPQFSPLKPSQQEALAAHLSAKLIGEHHYKPVPLDDRLSEKVFEGYLKSLDAEKMLFTQADVDQFKLARTKLDDAIRNDDLDLPFAIFNLYGKRMVERFTYARSLLKTGFDFRPNETFQYIRDKDPWAKSESEIRELWRKRVKNDWLQLKLAGKDDKKIAETLDKRYENFLKRIAKLKSEDAFQIFMNAYTMAVDPHTNYLGPRSSEDFGISMKLSLVGIGAVLEDKDDYATVKDLVPGSPAALSEQLKVGDRIAGVAQGDKAAMTDVVGWRLDDTVGLIRGQADTKVILDVIPAGANLDVEHKTVTLIRKKITLEDQAAKKSILSVGEEENAYRIGVISLPGFYEDFQARQKGEPDYKSATRDVSRLLEELKAEKVDAVLVDLRNNGGGSLTEAIELTGLFLGSGPVVQQRDAHGEISVSKGMAPGAVWDGPMAVLINRGSASASEIFAAAIQDYRRGLIIGENSFGKGTVQTVVDLDSLAHSDNAQLGDLKLTIAQFFRVNGGTTQLRGVAPDIQLPSTSDAEHFGESSFGNGLPWMRIGAADYHPVADLHGLIPTIQHRHDIRVAKDKTFQELVEDIAEYNQQRKQNQLSLNESERRKEREAQRAKLKKRGNGGEKGEADGTDETDEKQIEKQQKEAKDALLKEAASILGDSMDLTKERSSLAARGPSNPGRMTRKPASVQ